MPVKSIRFPNQTTYDGKITSLTEKEKEVLKKAGIGGGSNVNILVGSAPTEVDGGVQGTYSGVPDKSKINILHIDNFGDFVITFLTNSGCTGYVNDEYGKITILLSEGEYALKLESSEKYSHFISIFNDFDSFYFTYQNTSEDKINTLDRLKTALNGKSLLCNGHSGADTIAQYISGDDPNIIIVWGTRFPRRSDSDFNSIAINSTYTITDEVSPIE